MACWSQVPVGGVTFTVRIRSDDSGVDFGVSKATVNAIPITYSVYQFAENDRLVDDKRGPHKPNELVIHFLPKTLCTIFSPPNAM